LTTFSRRFADQISAHREAFAPPPVEYPREGRVSGWQDGGYVVDVNGSRSVRQSATNGSIPVGGVACVRGRVDAQPAIAPQPKRPGVRVDSPAGGVKILFSKVEDGVKVYYVGGHKPEPKKLGPAPIFALDSRSARLTNTGRNPSKFIASISGPTPGRHGTPGDWTILDLKSAQEIPIPGEPYFDPYTSSNQWVSPLLYWRGRGFYQSLSRNRLTFSLGFLVFPQPPESNLRAWGGAISYSAATGTFAFIRNEWAAPLRNYSAWGGSLRVHTGSGSQLYDVRYDFSTSNFPISEVDQYAESSPVELFPGLFGGVEISYERLFSNINTNPSFSGNAVSEYSLIVGDAGALVQRDSHIPRRIFPGFTTQYSYRAGGGDSTIVPPEALGQSSSDPFLANPENDLNLVGSTLYQTRWTAPIYGGTMQPLLPTEKTLTIRSLNLVSLQAAEKTAKIFPLPDDPSIEIYSASYHP
jgi:hypothetical protein